MKRREEEKRREERRRKGEKREEEKRREESRREEKRRKKRGEERRRRSREKEEESRGRTQRRSDWSECLSSVSLVSASVPCLVTVFWWGGRLVYKVSNTASCYSRPLNSGHLIWEQAVTVHLHYGEMSVAL